MREGGGQVLWKGDFITQKDGKFKALCSAIGCATLNPQAPANTKSEIQHMIHRLFQVGRASTSGSQTTPAFCRAAFTL